MTGVEEEWLENFTCFRELNFDCAEGRYEVCRFDEFIDKNSVITNLVISWYDIKSSVPNRLKQTVYLGLSQFLFRYDVQNSRL